LSSKLYWDNESSFIFISIWFEMLADAGWWGESNALVESR
jgi:hypothetical protein